MSCYSNYSTYKNKKNIHSNNQMHAYTQREKNMDASLPLLGEEMNKLQNESRSVGKKHLSVKGPRLLLNCHICCRALLVFLIYLKVISTNNEKASHLLIKTTCICLLCLSLEKRPHNR